MTTIHKIPAVEPRTAALLVSLAVGLGLAVHAVFFLVALAILVLVVLEWGIRKMGRRIPGSRLLHRHA
jgi:hypothetical protein